MKNIVLSILVLVAILATFANSGFAKDDFEWPIRGNGGLPIIAIGEDGEGQSCAILIVLNQTEDLLDVDFLQSRSEEKTKDPSISIAGKTISAEWDSMDLQGLRLLTGMPIVGALGISWFDGYSLHFNLDEGKLTGSRDELSRATDEKREHSFPLLRQADGISTFTLDLAGHEIDVALGTALDSDILIPTETFDNMVDNAVITERKGSEIATGKGYLEVRKGEIEDPGSSLGGEGKWFPSTTPSPYGTIGMGLLHFHNFSFGHGDQILFLTQRKGVPKNSGLSRFEISVIFPAGSKPSVYEIAPSSPFAVGGVMKGDLILSINGSASVLSDRYTLEAFLAGVPAGTTLPVSIRRTGELIEVEVVAD